jgi:hypothetical protein
VVLSCNPEVEENGKDVRSRKVVKNHDTNYPKIR